MNRFIIDEFYRNPALHRKLSSYARHERAKAVGEILGWLRQRLSPRATSRDWLARLG